MRDDPPQNARFPWPLGSLRAAFLLRAKANPGPTRGGKAGVAPLAARLGRRRQRPDYLTPAGRPVKDHFGLWSSITSARLRSRMRLQKNRACNARVRQKIQFSPKERAPFALVDTVIVILIRNEPPHKAGFVTRRQENVPMEIAIALIIGFALGYGIREWISRRRHQAEKRRRGMQNVFPRA